VSKDVSLPLAGVSESLNLPLHMANVFRSLLLSANDFRLPLLLFSKGLTIKLRLLPECLVLLHPLTSVFLLLRPSEGLRLDFHLHLRLKSLTKDHPLSLLLDLPLDSHVHLPMESFSNNPQLSLLPEGLPLDFHLPLRLKSLIKDHSLSHLSQSLPLDSHLPFPLASLVDLPLLSEKTINLQFPLSEHSMAMPFV
jgi:hypothetical protein